MKILFAASEAYPFVKTGGLGDVVGSLPVSLKRHDLDIRVILPKYGDIHKKYKEKMRYMGHTYVELGWRKQYCGIETLKYNEITYYFVDNEYYFKRPGYYGYYDEGEKFIYFAKAVIESISVTGFEPDVIHCHDWHTALLPFLIKNTYWNSKYQNIKTMLTIHNLKYQGVFSKNILREVLGLDDSYFNTECFEFFDAVNLLKSGMIHADMITTVSPSYSEEIQYPYYGENLDGVLRKYNYKLHGILNGIDSNIYNPENDSQIYANYGPLSIEKKIENKLIFQKENGLPQGENIPIVSIVSRLTEQKGIDLINGVIHDIMQSDIQLVVLGTGSFEYEEMFKNLVWQYPNKIRIFMKFDEGLSRRIYAASDMVLMPSKFEPCGITQMIAMKYGALPIVRETGGLKDTVLSCEANKKQGTGFLFHDYNAHDFLYTLQRAIKKYYENKDQWKRWVLNAMNQDLSWTQSAYQYKHKYQLLVEKDAEKKAV